MPTYYTFTPTSTLPSATWEAGAHPLANRLSGHCRPGVEVENVWIWSDDTVSTDQPPYWDQNPEDPSTPYVRRVFYGSHSYTDVTEAEKALLEGAGYTVT